ncbi:hypothetical protein TNCV_504091 [Trichonephila clavipes]|nr:hypothetical protein TNCV_504091 [Trichonephila clavipes]
MKYLAKLADQVLSAMSHFYPDIDRYFTNDNEITYPAESVQNRFTEQQSHFHYLRWPSHIPEINAMVNVCDMVKRHIRQQFPLSSNFQDLKCCTADAWKSTGCKCTPEICRLDVHTNQKS